MVYFDKEGNYLNFKYDSVQERYTGDLMFNENSSDTFKTIGLYLFERIPAFEFQVIGELALDKFQLFNEFGFNITGNKYSSESILKIEPINNDINFYSKWIYGNDFESKFPVGSQILFDSPIFEFTSLNNSYTVVSSKKNAIMIISNVDNKTFNTIYSIFIDDQSYYLNKTITGLNSVGVYNYVDSSINNTISSYSEPSFYTKYYNGKKLTLVNTDNNDGVVSIINKDILDKIYFKYELPITSFTSSDVIIELVLKTDLPLVYSGGLEIQNNVILFSNNIPRVLKPGTQFSVNSNINTNFISVSSIPEFLGNTQLTYYATQSQVLWNSKISQCVTAYTQNATSSITPDDNTYWTSDITYLPVDGTLIPEVLIYSEIHLTTNRLYYNCGFTMSTQVTLASAAEKFKEEFKLFNVDLYYENSILHSDLLYSSEYVDVNYYNGVIGLSTQIGNDRRIYENNVQVSEILNPELNINISSNFEYNIVFTDIDEFGIIIRINGMVYQIETTFVYVGLSINMERTIDRSLRNWLVKHFSRLTVLGVKPTLLFIGNYSSIYFNSIILKSEYPNVPIEFSVEVGTTADFHIEHSTVLFTDLGGQLSLNINNRSYDEPSVISGSASDIDQTLINWVDNYGLILEGYGIFVSNINNLLIFNIKEKDTRLEYKITIGKSFLPGLEPFKIKNKILGHEGSIITSNEVTLPSESVQSFNESGFATGMVFSINNTINPINNQEYNILHIEQGNLVLSYQGPFWKTKPDPCDVSPFVTLAYDNGFGSTGCPSPIIGPSASTGLGGEFSVFEFDAGFSIVLASVNDYLINNYVGGTNMVDIEYIQLSENMYTLGNNVTVLDASLGTVTSTITLSGNTQSIALVYNTVNNYLYALTINNIYIIDPLLDSLLYSISLSGTPFDLIVNTLNGDVYVSYSDSNKVDIWNISNFTNTPSYTVVPPSSATSHRLVYNVDENDIYVSLSSGNVLRIDGSTRSIQTTYSISGLVHSMFYEPTASSVYVFGTNLYKINNGVVTSIPGVLTGFFNEMLFNNVTSDLVISQGFLGTQSKYTRLDLSDNVLSSSIVGSYGYLIINQFDGDVYLSTQEGAKILVMNSMNGIVKHTESFSGVVSRMSYNPLRESIWGIQPSLNSIVEVEVDLGSTIIVQPPIDTTFENQFGTLGDDYVPKPELWLKTREYIRKPRENLQGGRSVKYIWKWLTDETPQMFIFDFTGRQLPETGPYTYTGPKPLDLITLNRFPNKDVSRVNLSEFQQTIFSSVTETLDFIDSDDNISFMPEPMELFLGFNSPDEGPMSSKLLLMKHEDVVYDISSSITNNNVITFKFIDGVVPYGEISLNLDSTDTFIVDSDDNDRGLKINQHIKIKVSDITNIKNKHISFNNGKIFKIRELYNRIIVVDFINDVIVDETTVVIDYPTISKTTYMNVNIKVEDKEIGRFNVFGQTEIEDIRYKIELTNTGHNVTSDDIFIFKTYDINEQGVDWGFLNRKRKEMLMVRHEIFPYVGSYKAIINAINYFGYNDLELYEYYRNINVNSGDFSKLFKVEIPDIFDNSVEGWHENDFIKHTIPNVNFEDTNLFNLTYRITDKQGNNVLLYSLNEVIIKLNGLKKWLESNVIPITHKILDITGRTDFVGGVSIGHKSYDTRIINVDQDMTPVDFKLNEAYLMPINSGSSVYNAVIDFYVENDDIPDYFTMNIRTYKTYKEWNPFTTYNVGNNVTYFDKVYESTLNSNKLRNPRKYENVITWNMNVDYVIGDFSNYNRDIYEYIGTQSIFTTYGTQSSILTPYNDELWINITEWRVLDMVPVQSITEYRTNLLPFNFTIDSNIDPFIVIDVTSDNGYGLIYKSRKNYEIRGLLDITEDIPTPPSSPNICGGNTGGVDYMNVGNGDNVQEIG